MPSPQAAVLDSSSDQSLTSPLPYTKSEMRDVAAYNDREQAGFPERQLSWSPMALFRFSALTFNAHMIHYNEAWTRNVERHPAVVVHGPLNLICMMDYWRDMHSDGSRDGVEQVEEVRYRATAPVYVGEPYQIVTSAVTAGGVTSFGEQRVYELHVEKGNKVCMRGEVLSRHGGLGN